MAYSMPLPRCETKCLFLDKISLTVLNGKVNWDSVRKAVKLAVQNEVNMVINIHQVANNKRVESANEQ